MVAAREGRRQLLQDGALKHVIAEGGRVSTHHAADALVRLAGRNLVPAVEVGFSCTVSVAGCITRSCVPCSTVTAFVD